MALRTVGVRLTADVLDYQRKLRAAGQSTKDFVGEMDKAAKAGRLDMVADSVGAVGLGLAGMAGFAVKASMDFEKSMSGIKAATHAGTAEMEQLREAALKAGQDTQFSATGAADAITELSKAGVATADILNGGLNGALDLAAAGQLDVAEAAETAASAMTQFKLSGRDVPHIADLLAAGAGKAQGSVHDLGMALNQSGLIAAQTGLTIEETTGGLAAFANAGLIGSDAGTSFKQMLLMLQAPSDKSKDLMDELGISLYDAQGQFVGLTKFAGQLQTALKDLTPEARSAAMAQIFGADATRAASIMYEQGADGIQKWIDKVNDQGYAQETARILTDNLAGDIERLKGSIETLAISAGSASNGGLRTLVQLLDGIVDGIGSLPPMVTNVGTVLVGVGGLAALSAAGWVKARRASAEFHTELSAIGPAGERASRGLRSVTSAATKATLVFAGLQAAGALINQFQKDLKPQVEAMAKGLETYASGGQLAGEASRVLGKDLEDLKVGFAFLADEDNNRRKAVKNIQDGLEGLIPGLDGTNTSLTKTRERITAMDAALAQLAQGGNATTANEIFQKLAEELATGGVTMEEFRKQFPQYAAALEVASKSTGEAAGKADELGGALGEAAEEQEEYKSATEAATAATKGQRDALMQLSEFMKAETQPVFGLIDAQDKLAKAQKNAAKAAKEHGRNSAEAKEANRELALAAIALQGAVGALGESFDGKMTPALRDTLRAAGLTDKQIADLEKQFKSAKDAADKYDGKYEAETSAPGATKAKKDLDNAYTAANKFAGPYIAEVGVTGYAVAKDRLLDLMSAQYKLAHPNASASDIAEDRREKARFMATGGPVLGPGSGTSDSIAAWLSNGEHVWTADEVAKLGGQQAMMGLRAAVRQGKRVEFGDETPGFAQGGPVTRMPFPVSAAGTYIMPREQALALIVPPIGSGDMIYKQMQAAIKGAFPGLEMISGFRRGATTLSGNRSYHSLGRAVDYPPSKPLAEWINANYFGRTKELITPWNSLNIHNGRRHRYTGAVWNQHNFAGGNAHDHWAMANGGTINEPIFGVGASGRTYSFGENYQPERVIPNWQGGGGGGNTTILNLNLPSTAGVNPVEYGRQVATALQPYLAAGGTVVVRGKTVLSGSPS